MVQGRVNWSAKSNSSKNLIYSPTELSLPEFMNVKVTYITFRVSAVAESELEYFGQKVTFGEQNVGAKSRPELEPRFLDRDETRYPRSPTLLRAHSNGHH